MPTPYLIFKRQLRGSLNARFDGLRISRLRELKGLVFEMLLLVAAIRRKPSPFLWCELCMVTRRYAVLFQDRWLTLSGELFHETIRDFIASLEEGLALRDAVFASCNSDEDRATVEAYYGNMHERLESARRRAHQRTPAEIEPAAVVNLKSEPQISESSIIRAIFLAAANWVLAKKLLAIKTELQHEVGPLAAAILEHYAFAHSAEEIFQLLLNLASPGAATRQKDELQPFLERAEQLKRDLNQTVCVPLEGFCGKRRKFVNGAGFDEVRDQLQTEADTLIKTSLVDVHSLIERATNDWKRLRERLPDSAWEAWMMLGTEDAGMQPPQITSQEHVKPVGEQLACLLQNLSSISDFPALESWLELVTEYGFTEQTGTAADDAALAIIGRLLALSFEATQPHVHKLMTEGGAHFTRGSFQLALAGSLVSRFKNSIVITEQDRLWLDELLTAILPLEAAAFGTQQSKEAVIGSLLSLSFFISPNKKEIAASLLQRLLLCLNSIVRPKTRSYFLQFIVDTLRRLITPESRDQHFFKLIALHLAVKPENLVWNDDDLFASVEGVLEDVRSLSVSSQ